MLDIKTTRTVGAPWSSIVPTRIGESERHEVPPLHVLVEVDGLAAKRIEVLGESIDPDPVVIAWGDRIAIGCTSAVHIVPALPNAEPDAPITIPLDAPFQSFHETRTALLVATQQSILRVDPDGKVLWQSATVGISGIEVERVTRRTIDGTGDWKPLGKTRPFRIGMRHGRVHPRLLIPIALMLALFHGLGLIQWMGKLSPGFTAVVLAAELPLLVFYRCFWLGHDWARWFLTLVIVLLMFPNAAFVIFDPEFALRDPLNDFETLPATLFWKILTVLEGGFGLFVLYWLHRKPVRYFFTNRR